MLRVLHIEDDSIDAELIYRIVTGGVPCTFWRVSTKAALLAALANERFDLIISDSNLPGFDGVSAMKLARNRFPKVPFVFCSGYVTGERKTQMLNLGAFDFFPKDDLEGLLHLVKKLSPPADLNTDTGNQNF
jgi:phosphoserine phosphatase RsbU/P